MSDPKRIQLPVLGAGADLVALEPLVLPDGPILSDDVPTVALAELDLDSRTGWRTSSYTVYVDLPGNTDEMLLVHGYTGAYDQVSKRVATYLRSLEARHAPKPLYGDWEPEPANQGEIAPPSEQTIAILKKRGYLVPLTVEEEEALFVRVASQYHKAGIRRPPGYILMPTYQCNLRCHYCFQDHMRTDPAFHHLLRVIDRDTADRILRGMDHIDAAHGIAEDAERTRMITFFGGEPLLASSRPIIEYLIKQLRARTKASFTAITNATDLHAFEDLLGGDGITELQITLDGPPSEHDKRRIYEDGTGSFERIAANLTMALDRGVSVGVRMNIDRINIEQLAELGDEFESRGWNAYPNFRPYVAPIHAANENVDHKTTFNSWQLAGALKEKKKQHPHLARIGLSDDMLQQQAYGIFKSTTQPSFRTAFCGAHTGMYVIDAFADIYACWEVTGDPAVRVGHIKEDGQVFMNRSLLEGWRGRSVVSNPVCRKCRYATSCGGGCAVLAEGASGDSYANYCDGYAKRFRAAIAEAYQKHINSVEVINTSTRLCDV